MTYALNEVEALAKRAARGAGYQWGLAEEAAKATRWLCGYGMDGCDALASLLRQVDAGEVGDTFEIIRSDTALGLDGAICPLTFGATLSDRALPAEMRVAHLETVAEPRLLLPFAASLAAQVKEPIKISASLGYVVTDGRQLSLQGSLAETSGRVTVEIGGCIVATDRARHSRAAPNPAIWEELSRIAHRTYAPATELSRRLGAGVVEAGNG